MPSVDYEALFATHREHLWGLCYRVTGSAADAEDLVQETFRRAIEKPPADTTRPWRPWLARVATRLAIDALRRRRTRRYVGPWLPTPIETPVGAVSGERASAEASAETRYGLRESVSFAFLRALEALGPAQRATLVLRDALGYTGPETAELLGVSPDNARVMLHRARQAMARYDETRQPPSPEVDAQHQQALQRFMAAVAEGDVHRIAALLAEDARASSDAGGRYRAATKTVVGRERVARLFAGLSKHGAPPLAVELRWLNGRPAVLAALAVRDDRDSPLVCLSLDLDGDGAVAQVHLVTAEAKLAGLTLRDPPRPS